MCRSICCVRDIVVPVVRHLVSKFGGEDHHFTHNPNGIPNKGHVRLMFMWFRNKDKDKIGITSTSLHFPKSVLLGDDTDSTA